MKRFFLISCLFCIPLGAGSYVLSKILDSAFRHNRSQKPFWILSQQGVSVDYVIAGNSRAIHNVDNSTLGHILGTKSINIADNGCGLIDSYMMFKLFLTKNTCRHYVFQIDTNDLRGRDFHYYYYFPFLDNPDVQAVMRQLTASRYFLWRIFPLAKYWEYNDYFNLRTLLQSRSKESIFDKTNGSMMLEDDNYHVFPTVGRVPKFEVATTSRDYLDRIVHTATSHNIPVTFFTAPIYHGGSAVAFLDADHAACAYIEQYCQEKHISYHDFTNARFEKDEFRDYSHLNSHGALRFTAMLAEALLRDQCATPPPASGGRATANDGQ